ncbi:hypothetical protein ACFWOJ_12970 [Streptomyces sp. NPDC058439]|uniref:hypothetical protein n=1 Tax=Streptomyces sp. NPDC058439 TaxID=3346500 RepID=UPI003669CC2D
MLTLTLTLTGLAADSGPARRSGAPARPGRRILSVLAMFLSALVGAVLLKIGLSLVLASALALLATGAAVLWRLSVPGAGWAAAT